MSNLVLYRQDGSCSMVAHILLTELGLPFHTVPLRAGDSGYEAADGTFSHADYVERIHPAGCVPALSVDGEVITENPAILRYIASLAPERFVDEHVDMHPTIMEKGYKTILACYDRINIKVGDEYAVGSGLTVVDLYLHTFYRWGRLIGVDMGQYPGYEAVMRRIGKLASVKKVMAEESQDPDLLE